MQRRNFLLGVGITTLTSPLLITRAYAAESQGEQVSAEEIVDLLYVQSARGSSLESGVLTLRTINMSTIFFSDRPERIVGHESTEDFISDWDVGEDNFASNPPNATLSILSGEEPQEIIVVLKNPRLEQNDGIYDVQVLDGNERANGGASSLFIDTIGRPLTRVSVSGVHRRHRRRRRRRAVRTPGRI